jgi:hypothetical protein
MKDRNHEGFVPMNSINTLRAATESVLERLPADIKLAEHAYISRYPSRRNWLTGEPIPGTVFSVHFMSTEDLNVATWIPDMGSTPQMHLNSIHAARGRMFGALYRNQGTYSIAVYLSGAHCA